jgi:pimeloyl-ACP methyl ester carboxylesterase
MNPQELNSDGTLKDPSKLIDNKVIGSQAKISLPTYDIDDKAINPGFSPEIDKIYFNGEYIKDLSGYNGKWVNDSFPVDIGKVKFNAENEIRVEIDAANAGSGEYWCMAVDWVAIEYDAAAPYVLAHGINAQSDTWDEAAAPGVLNTMDNSSVLYRRFSTGMNGSVASNAKDLKKQISTFLDTVKSKKVNIIAHSKGGLDSQALAKISKPEFEVLSLSTLSTPHRGSVVADLQLLQRKEIDEYVNKGQDPNGYAQQFVSLSLAGWASREKGAGPQLPGLNDLTTQSASSAILAGIRGNVKNTFTIGSDVGPECKRQPSDVEIDPLADEAPFGTKGYTYDALRLAYQAICDFTSATDLDVPTQEDGWFGTKTVQTYSTQTLSSKQSNDIVVGVRSAHPGWGTPITTNSNINHSEIKNGTNVQKFLDRTIKLR